MMCRSQTGSRICSRTFGGEETGPGWAEERAAMEVHGPRSPVSSSGRLNDANGEAHCTKAPATVTRRIQRRERGGKRAGGTFPHFQLPKTLQSQCQLLIFPDVETEAWGARPCGPPAVEPGWHLSLPKGCFCFRSLLSLWGGRLW